MQTVRDSSHIAHRIDRWQHSLMSSRMSHPPYWHQPPLGISSAATSTNLDTMNVPSIQVCRMWSTAREDSGMVRDHWSPLISSDGVVEDTRRKSGAPIGKHLIRGSTWYFIGEPWVESHANETRKYIVITRYLTLSRVQMWTNFLPTRDIPMKITQETDRERQRDTQRERER